MNQGPIEFDNRHELVAHALKFHPLGFPPNGPPKKIRPKVYLAGPMSGLTFGDAASWREWLVQRGRGSFEFISPLRGKEGLLRENEHFTSKSYDAVLSNSRAIATRDRWDVTRADALVVNMLDAVAVSVGTCVELGWADQARVPIVLIMEEEGNLHDHVIIRHIAGFQVTSLEEALRTLDVLFA